MNPPLKTPQTLGAFLKDFAQKLEGKDPKNTTLQGEGALREAHLLASKALDISTLDVLGKHTKPLQDFAQHKRLMHWAARRLSGEVVPRILGERGFWKHTFNITKDVLDPRADSEHLVQAACDLFAKQHPQKFLELGTGSGCLVCSLLKEWPNAQACGIDCSKEALSVTDQNAKKLGVANRLKLLQGSWFAPLKATRKPSRTEPQEHFDLIISNPPYIPKHQLKNLTPEVCLFDPSLALDGGEDGLDAFRAIIPLASLFLKPKSFLVFEIGFDQKESVHNIAKKNFTLKTTHKDFSGHDRVMVFQKNI